MSRILKPYLIFIVLCAQSMLFSRDVTIIGASYVGLTMGSVLAADGFNISCYDINSERIKNLQNKQLPIFEPGLGELLFKTDGVQFTDNPNQIDAPLILISVGTPPDKDGKCDLSYIFSALDLIIHKAPSAQVICVKSTIAPGSLKKIQDYLISCDRSDLQLIFNPEFMREGSALADIYTKNPIVLASKSPHALVVMKDLYKSLIDSGLPVIDTNFETAEIIKYAWNSFSALRIGYVNELSRLCRILSADVFAVVKALALSEVLLPTAVLKPGPGYGGSCLPKDTQAFAHILEEHGYESSLVHQAIESNKNHVNNIIDLIKTTLGTVENKVISILGVSFKANTDDIRNAPSIDIIHALNQNKAQLKIYDPVACPNLKLIFPDLNYCSSAEEAITNADCIVALTDWPEIVNLDLDRTAHRCKQKIIIDMRNIFDPAIAKDKGFILINAGKL